MGTVALNVKPSQRVLFFSLRWKLLLGFTLVFSVVFAAAFYWFLTYSTNTALDKIQNDLENTVSGAAKGVNTEELLALANEGVPNADGFTDDPRFQDQLNWLDTVHQIEPRAWPYIYIPGKETNEIIYVVDLFARYDANRATTFLKHKISKGFSLAGLKEMTIRTTDGKFDTYEDEYGSWVSAYTPIRDAQGKIVGAMGMDFEASYVNRVRQAILDKIVVAFAITYLTLFVLVYLVSRTLTSPIRKLTRVAEKISEGDYNQDFAQMIHERFPDEIDTLTSVFGVMASKIYQREQSLRAQVEQLKIEIDDVKRQRQVAEIADTDFFKELKSKAILMRQRHATSS
ncbi:protein containg HAMP domain [Longilinea arvoryzae]|uniref:histidine kinase n=1 Tax=Longilinea arvoryzae TaxID=360412 RepID=A0A0S7BE26_9CHLR|nr:HAMP domain-containing protein [Longilinea arvoryzae]GAP13673.1 protein containg HAMP domain [Longilinea arvoryzae]